MPIFRFLGETRRCLFAPRTTLALFVATAVPARAPSADPCASYADYLHWAGSVETPGDARAVFPKGDLLYVADGNAGLTILSIDALGRTAVVSNLDLPQAAFDVVVMGSYAYVADDRTGLVTVRIDDPAHPIVTSIRLLGTTIAARAVAVSGMRVFVAGAHTGPGGALFAYDITFPAQPRLLDGIDTPWRATGMVLRDGLAFVTDTMCFETGCFGGFGVYDVSSPTALDEIGYIGLGPVTGILLVDDYAYVSATEWGLWVVDISNPRLPILVTSREGYAGNGIARRGDAIFVTSETLHAFDITNRESPEPITELLTPPAGAATRITIDGARGYVVDGGEVQLVGLASAQPVPELSFLPATGTYRALAFDGATVFAAGGTRFEVLDFSDPAAPVLLGSVTLPTAPSALLASGGFVYAACGVVGVSVVNVSNPAAPVLVVTKRLAGTASALAERSGFLYVGTSGSPSDRAVRVIDVHDPAHPVEIAATPTPDDPTGLAVDGARLYVADSSVGLLIYDVTVPSQFVPEGAFDLTLAKDVAVSGALACVSDVARGLVVLDVSDPGDVRPLSETSLPGSADRVRVGAGIVLVGAGQAGLLAFDLGAPEAPIAFGGLDLSGAPRALVILDEAVLSGGPEGLRAFPPPCAVLGVEVPAGSNGPFAALAPGVPNPFRADTRISFDLSVPARVTLRVYDALGRSKRVLIAGEPWPAGRHTTAWDGRDEAGREVPPGSYFYEIRAGGKAARGKLTRLP